MIPTGLIPQPIVRKPDKSDENKSETHALHIDTTQERERQLNTYGWPSFLMEGRLIAS
jgi:hypothetical protein